MFGFRFDNQGDRQLMRPHAEEADEVHADMVVLPRNIRSLKR